MPADGRLAGRDCGRYFETDHGGQLRGDSAEHTGIHDIVAKGGNLLLNIGPQPDGTLPPVAVGRLEEIGRWMDVNAQAIHGTRPVAPYKEGPVALTRKGPVIYAIYLAGDKETSPPAQVSVPSLRPEAGSEIRLLGCRQPCAWRITPTGLQIDVPAAAREKPPCQHAWVFQAQGSTRPRTQ